MTIEIQNAEYRPCLVDGKKALFHRWAEKQQAILKITNVCSAEVIVAFFGVIGFGPNFNK